MNAAIRNAAANPSVSAESVTAPAPRAASVLAAAAVACPAADEQERSERQRVGGDDPLEVGARGAEVALDRRQGDGDDHAVEHHEHVGGA